VRTAAAQTVFFFIRTLFGGGSARTATVLAGARAGGEVEQLPGRVDATLG